MSLLNNRVQRNESTISRLTDKHFKLLTRVPSRRNVEGSDLNYLNQEEWRFGEHLLSWKPDSQRSKFHREIQLKSGAVIKLLFEWNSLRPSKRYIALMLNQPGHFYTYLELFNVAVRLDGHQFIKLNQSLENKEKWGPVQLKNHSCPSLVEIFLSFDSATSAERSALNCLTNLPEDFKIVVKDRVFVANAYLLAAASPVFSAMFHNDFIESINRSVAIDDVEPDVFKQLLGFIYGIEPNYENQVAQKLLAAADKYDIQPLKQKCAQVLLDTLSKENAIRVLYLADYHGVTYLVNHVKTYIIDNWGPEERYRHHDRELLINEYSDIVEEIDYRMAINCQVTNF